MQINEYSRYLAAMQSKANEMAAQATSVTPAAPAEAFDSVLNDCISEVSDTKNTDDTVEKTQESAEKGSNLSELSDNLLNTRSGRAVIASMVESQIMGIVTGSQNDEDTSTTLQTLLYGTSASDTLSNLEEILQSISEKSNN